MGKRGPAPKPTNVRQLHGDRKDRINTNEPQPGAGAVASPQWLSPAARAVWDELAEDLRRAGVLTAWDVEAYAAYCDAVVRRRRAAAELDGDGVIVEVPVYRKDGEAAGHRQARSPWWLIWRDADEVMRRYAARFGFTPSDRAQISVNRDGQGDPDDDLLTGT